MNVLQLVLFSLLLLSLYCSESQKREKAIFDGSGHITTSVSCSGKMDDKTLRRRCFRRRRMVKWCDSRMKAKEIDDEAGLNNIVASSVFVLCLIFVLEFVRKLEVVIEALPSFAPTTTESFNPSLSSQ